ncbi:MAG: cyclic nucleotide-binding domain-containing protein [Beijerinckiaceae bacterium]|nr:cyclic nucleotide-binding domain-containing protein [Beijerinckiaceae bacterium]
MAPRDLRPDAGEAPLASEAPGVNAPAARRHSPLSLLTEALAGVTTSVVLVGNIVAFSALMFPAPYSGGITVALWAMLLGSGLTGIWIAMRTSIPPLASGIDTPTGAVLVVLAATITAAVTAAGGSPASAILAAMLSFTLVALVSGAALFLLGWFRLGYLFRFVPYSVVGGFLAATGWFLLVGGFGVATGHPTTLSHALEWFTADAAIKLVLAVCTTVAMLRARAMLGSPFAVPGVLIVLWAGGAFVLRYFGLNDPQHGWYIGSQFDLVGWSPIATALNPSFPWPVLLHALPEIFAAATVTLLSLVTKTTSIEVTRSTSADLDAEFRAHGVSSLLIAPVGGVAGAVQVGSSKLLVDAGGTSRLSGVFASLVLIAVLLSDVNIVGFIPLPLVIGLSFYLGYGFITDALRRPIKMGAWVDVALILAIAFACARFGYMVGVAAGFLSACLLFAINYARVDVIKRRLSRATFASNVDRPRQDAGTLRERGDAIQIYWLSGYIFFGSSDRVFERIRADVNAKPQGYVKFVLLDFSAVTGADSSAVMSLLKLKNFAERAGVRIVYSGLTPAGGELLVKEGLVGGKNQHRMFDTCDSALEWCEQNLLAMPANAAGGSFDEWLLAQINPPQHAGRLMSYFERVEISDGRVLYAQGDPADTIDFVASGSLSIEITTPQGERLRVRRIATNSIVGEMGFFRRLLRSATVTSDGPAVIYSLSRANFERMRVEAPELAAALCEFVIQVLSDRVDFANRAISALVR